MTKITLELTDIEIQMMTHLLSEHREEVLNPSTAEILAFKKVGITIDESERKQQAEDITKTIKKIIDGYKEGEWLGRDK